MTAIAVIKIRNDEWTGAQLILCAGLLDWQGFLKDREFFKHSY